MDLPEWDPVVGVVKSQSLSGPIPARAALHIQCDQAVSHKRLAPSPAARMPVPPGHGLEIQMALWSATRARGTSLGSDASIPMGARCGLDPTPNPRLPGHAAERRAAGTATREPDEENDLLLSGVYRLDTGLLMGTPQETAPGLVGAVGSLRFSGVRRATAASPTTPLCRRTRTRRRTGTAW
jgi:hypothetical protein